MINLTQHYKNYHMSTALKKVGKPKNSRTEYYEKKNGSFGLIFHGGMDSHKVMAKLKTAYEKVHKVPKQTTQKSSLKSDISDLSNSK